MPGKSHGQRSLVGPAHGVAESQTALSDFPFLRTCTFSTVGSASVTPETVTEDATTVPTGVTQSSHRHTLPHPSPPIQDPGSGPSRDPCSLCPSPAFCGLREAAPIVLDSVLQSEPFVFLLRSRDASPSGRPCAACLPTSRAGPAPCPCHALGVAVARVSETLLPVVRQWYLSLGRWLSVLQPPLIQAEPSQERTLPEAACISGCTDHLWTTQLGPPAPRRPPPLSEHHCRLGCFHTHRSVA